MGVTRLVDRALAAISCDVLYSRLRYGDSMNALVEEVQYQGRRLANLGLSFTQVKELLRDQSSSADSNPTRRSLVPRIVAEVSEAFHQVRDLETRTYLNLFRTELLSSSVPDFLHGAIDALAPYTRAAASRAWIFDAAGPCWTLAASVASDAPEQRTGAGALCNAWDPACLPGHSCPSPDPAWAASFRTVWTFPILAGEELLGLLEFGFAQPYEWLPRERDLLTAAAQLSAQAVRKTRLVEQLAARERDIRGLLEQLINVEESERRRIGRDLHDEAGQSLMCLRLQLELVDRELSPESAARVRLRDARETADRILEEVRRIMAALSPSVLEHSGLCAAVRQLIKRFRALHPAQWNAELPSSLDLPPRIEIAAYRMIQELFNNIVKHAQAESVHLTLLRADEYLEITVADDGIGFDPQIAVQKPEAGALRRECFGLRGLQDRARLLGGVALVTSVPRDTPHDHAPAGATVQIRIPLPKRTEE